MDTVVSVTVYKLIAVRVGTKRRPVVRARSVHDSKVSLMIREHARQSPDRNSRCITFRAGWLSPRIKKLPGEQAALFPSCAFRPDQQHLTLHTRCHGRMFSIRAVAG